MRRFHCSFLNNPRIKSIENMIKSLYCVGGFTLIISALIHKLLKARSMKFDFFPVFRESSASEILKSLY